MGIFSSKTKTQVGTSVVRVIEDSGLPDAVKTGVMKGILRDEDINKNILEDLVSSLAIRAERMYTYGEKHYTHGSPSGDVFSDTKGRTQVQAILNGIEGTAVFMAYSYFGPANNLHVGWMQLVQDHGYTVSNNQLAVLTAQKGTPVYLKDMVAVVPRSVANAYEPNAFEQWDVAPNGGYTPERPAGSPAISSLVKNNLPIIDDVLTEVQLRVTYVWKVGVVLHEGTLLLTMGVYDDNPDADYYQAKYTVNGLTKYWIYRYGAGTYAALDQVYETELEASGSYFPFTYFRYNKQSTNSNKTSAAYKTSKKMLNHLGMDFDVVADAIEENPGIADVQQAMLMLAVPAVSSNPVESEYLFKYFESQYFVSETRSGSALIGGSGGLTSLLLGRTSANTTVIQDRQFKMALGNNGIARKRVGGVIGAVGAFTSTFVTQTVDVPAESDGLISTISMPVNVHVYRQQVTESLYDEITVSGLRMVYYVLDNYTTVGDDQDAILLIPIDRSISQTLGLVAREELYARSLHMVFNSVIVTKVKWYQTDAFKAILFIIGVVLTVIYPPAGLTLLALTGTALVIAAIVFNLLLMMLLPAVFKLFVKVFGKDIATLIAVAAIIYGGYMYFTTPSVVGAPMAQAMLQVATGLQGAIMQDKFSDLLSEQNSFVGMLKKQTETLEEARNLLETTSFLSPAIIFGENPEDFYNRAIHTGNIGVLSISAISFYVDIALTLPKLDDTLEIIGESNE